MDGEGDGEADGDDAGGDAVAEVVEGAVEGGGRPGRGVPAATTAGMMAARGPRAGELTRGATAGRVPGTGVRGTRSASPRPRPAVRQPRRG
jgi:hypothetical protein